MSIRERRQALGMSRKKLAEDLGIATETLARYERNERELRSSLIPRLAQALHCDPVILLNEINPTPPSAAEPGAEKKEETEII